MKEGNWDKIAHNWSPLSPILCTNLPPHCRQECRGDYSLDFTSFFRDMERRGRKRRKRSCSRSFQRKTQIDECPSSLHARLSEMFAKRWIARLHNEHPYHLTFYQIESISNGWISRHLHKSTPGSFLAYPSLNIIFFSLLLPWNPRLEKAIVVVVVKARHLISPGWVRFVNAITRRDRREMLIRSRFNHENDSIWERCAALKAHKTIIKSLHDHSSRRPRCM